MAFEVPSSQAPLHLAPGPHLFVDDYLVAGSDGVQRRVMQPKRFLDAPVVTSDENGHRNWQPFLTVIQDPDSGRFRMWYDIYTNAQEDDRPEPSVGYMESADGIVWPGPYHEVADIKPLHYFVNMLQDDHTGPNERFKMNYFTNSTDPKLAGMRTAFSPDGLRWTKRLDGQPVMANGQPNDEFVPMYDPIRKRYFMMVKRMEPFCWVNAEGQHIIRPSRRFAVCFSHDFKNWTALQDMYAPDSRDPGITEFYTVNGWITRGNLMIGFMQILRDDLSSEGTPAEAIECNRAHITAADTYGRESNGIHFGSYPSGAGMGYTALTWTRDGESWQHDRQTDAFLEPDPRVGAWDHSMSWVAHPMVVGDEVYLYYAGYRWGHKYKWKRDRQLGLLKIKRDRYVARQAASNVGRITTPLVTLGGDRLTVNADAAAGEIRVQVCDASGKAIPGLTFSDCQPICGDSLDAPVCWKGLLSSVRGQTVRLEFAIRNASLFAFEVGESK